ncbi:MAG: ferrochelatase [Propionibacterium sp.]|nr:ferrochelatase [Propionibacterium sp.]
MTPMASSADVAAPYDALLLLSFGGPNRAEDVTPFLRNVVRGKNIPDERLEAVGEHYHVFAGKSPINQQNLALREALEAELGRRGIRLPVIWGNRNWHPYTVDTVRDALAFGARRILVLVTSAFASYSGSRQYREHLALMLEELGASAHGLQIDLLRPFFNDPGFAEANIEAIAAAGSELPGGLDGAHVVYVTHSIPDTMQDASAMTGPGYREQHEDLQRVIDDELRRRHGVELTSSLSYCSRSGSPRTPWLEPDVNDHLESLAAADTRRVVIAPIGFVSDHMEVIYDLDIEAMETAAKVGITAARAGTAGTAAPFVSGIVDMIVERAARERGLTPEVPVVGSLPAFPDVAPPGSCRMRHGEVTGIPVVAGTED